MSALAALTFAMGSLPPRPSLASFSLRPPPSQGVGVQSMPHPKTGAPGMWVPIGLFENMELAYDSMPSLQEENRNLKFELSDTRAALKLTVGTATSARARATKWERRADVLFDENLELRFKLNKVGDPWWARLLTLAIGFGLAFGSIELAKATILDRGP